MSNTKQIFDAWLILEYQSGSKKAIGLLVKRWHPKLCRQAFWYTKDMDASKDIAQDTWSVILRKLPLLRDPGSFGSWALKITTRKAIDWQRKQKKERQLKTDYDTSSANINSSATVDSNDDLEILRKAISKLPHLQQQILNLFYLEEFSIKQIGEILEISTGTVKSRLFTAREKIKTILKNRNYEK